MIEVEHKSESVHMNLCLLDCPSSLLKVGGQTLFSVAEQIWPLYDRIQIYKALDV